MPTKRRHTLSRSPFFRSKMWESKVEPETYSKYLAASKPLALPRVIQYQSTHEFLITLVKGILERYGRVHQTHDYMWYASKLYSLLNTYSGVALTKEATSVFLQYLVKGLNESILRAIASSLGIKISSLNEILEEIMSPLLLKIVAQGSIITNGTEQTILEYSGDIALISGYIDLSNMDVGDRITISIYTKLTKDGSYKLYHFEPFIGRQEKPTLYILPRLSGMAMKITIIQEEGTYKSFEYLFVKGV